LLAATGVDTIPALLLEDGGAVIGEEAIEVYLLERSMNRSRPSTWRCITRSR